LRRIKEALLEKRYNQQQRRFHDIYPQLSHAQLDELDAHAVILETQRPRRWWVLAYPDSQPPSKFRALLLGIMIVGIFGMLNTVVSDALIAICLRLGAPYQFTFLTYLLLAAPMAVIAIANLATQLHLLQRRAWERA